MTREKPRQGALESDAEMLEWEGCAPSSAGGAGCEHVVIGPSGEGLSGGHRGDHD